MHNFESSGYEYLTVFLCGNDPSSHPFEMGSNYQPNKINEMLNKIKKLSPETLTR